MPTDAPIVKAVNLTRRFGRCTAVDDVSFEVERGEIVGLLGPNGAGKTTTMRILACFLPPTGGTVTVAGCDVERDSLEVRRRIGYLPENVPLYGEMRVAEYLAYRARLKGLRGRPLRMRTDEMLNACGLLDVARQTIGRLSKGYRQRIGLADALVHAPELLILDEPTIGLDPNQVRQIRGVMKGLARHHTVLLSTHVLSEAEMVCDRVLIMNHGRIVASDTPESLMGLLRGNLQVIAEIRGDPQAIGARVRAIPGVQRVTCQPQGEWNRVTCECPRQADVRELLFAAAAQAGWVLRELTTERLNLEDVFCAMTREEPCATS